MTDKPSATPEDTSSSGTTSLEGFLYQQDVSVWVALTLVLVRKLASSVTLEPASQEDLETDLEDEPGAMAEGVDLDSYRLIIQCKVKRTGPWAHGDLTRLLSHGKKRTSAIERLKDKDSKYLLVTTADIQGVVWDLRVDELGVWPATAIPKDMAKTVPPEFAGRIAVLASMDEERLGSRITSVLTERSRVPMTKLEACRDQLRKEALKRMLGGSGGIWTRAELDSEIRQFGGYTGDSPDLEDFVPPTNWNDIKGTLSSKNAILITGASGTGKTKTARALIAELRNSIPGIRHEIVRGGPDKIFEDRAGGAVVYEIEDPWGKFRLDDNAVPWNDAIDEVLQSATKDRYFVVTSRSDVLKESAPKSLRGKWVVHLEEENYGVQQKRKLFANRIPGLPFDLQGIAIRYEKDAIERLATPLEMHRYFAILADGPKKDEGEGDYIFRSMKEANQNSIETSIVSNVESRKAWALAALVWGLFKSRDRQSFKMLPRIQSALAVLDSSLEDGLTSYLDFLIAGRNLRQTDEVLSYQHPRVELGLEQAMLARENVSSRMLGYLVRTLVELDTGGGGDWGTEAAASLLGAIASQEKLTPTIPAEMIQRINQWLEERVAATGPEFEDDLKLAAAVGSSNSNVAELARWLTYRDPSKDWRTFEDWQPPETSPEWYQRIAADPRTEAICVAFITRSLPRVHGRFGSDFPDAIAQLSANLTPAFIEAASRIIAGGYHPNDDAIFAGALKDISGGEPVVAEAIDYLGKPRSEADQKLHLALINGEYDQFAAEHYWEEAGEDGYTAREFLSEYVRLRRTNEGWRAIATHPLASGLVEAWFKVVRDEPPVEAAEWQAIAGLASGWEEAVLWERLRNDVPPALVGKLEKRLLEGHERVDVRVESVRAAMTFVPSLLETTVDTLVKEGKIARVLELVLDIAATPDREFKVDPSPTLDALKARVGAPLAELVQTFVTGQSSGLSDEAQKLLQSVGDNNRRSVLVRRAKLLASLGHDTRPLLRSILAEQNDYTDEAISDAVAAIEVADGAGYVDVVSEGLVHPFADVRREALKALAALSPLPLEAKLLSLASDKGNRVKSELVRILTERPDPGHLDTLIVLAADTWSNQGHYEEPENYPIAIAASKVVLAMSIDDAHVDGIERVVKETKDTDVQFNLLQALVKNGSEKARHRVLDLALTTGSPPLHRFATLTLISGSELLDPAELDRISDKQLMYRATNVAIPLACLLGLRGRPDRVMAATRALLDVPSRLVLFVPLLQGASLQSEDLGAKVRALMPHDLKSMFEEFPAELPDVSAGDLEPFGEIRIATALVEWLNRGRPAKQA